jgi:hypothetical protein
MVKTNKQRRTRRQRQSPSHMTLQTTILTGTGTSTTVDASKLMAVTATRSARMKTCRVTFVSGETTNQPRSFALIFLSPNQDAIYTTPTFVATQFPQSRTFKIPSNTDWGIYQPTDTVVTIDHATDSKVRFIMSLDTVYKAADNITQF